MQTKTIRSLLIGAAVAAALAGCGKKDAAPAADDAPAAQVPPAPAASATPAAAAPASLPKGDPATPLSA